MKLLIGGNSFIAKYYKENDSDIITVGRRNCDIELEKLDFNDEKLKDVTDVIYFISTVHNYHVFDDPTLDIKVNLQLLIEILQKFKDSKIKNATFNFISSWFVYGDSELPATEESVCNPKGFYSITKRAAEQLLESYCKTFDLNYRILRLSNVEGEGDRYSSKKNALQFLEHQIKNNYDIELYHGGDFYRCYTNVKEIVKDIKLVVEKGNKNEIYNVGDGTPKLFIDLINEFIKKYNSTSNIKTVEPTKFHKLIQVKDFFFLTEKLDSLKMQERDIF